MFGGRKERERAQLAELRADIGALQGRLASDISLLDPKDDAVARQALVDAAERNSAAGAVLAAAQTPGELAVARRTVIEGLTATRLVRERLGLPLGPDLPTPPSVPAAQPVSVGDEQHVAHPDYHPAQPHYFGGGSVNGQPVPAGYYKEPFWKKALAIGGAVVGAEMIGGAIGDMFGGGGFGGGGFGGGDYDGGDFDGGGFDGGGFDGGGDGGW